MDDFGTGYSSLSLPEPVPDRHPQDGPLVPRARSTRTSGLAAAIIALGKSLNLDVVAEGIELPEQIAVAARSRLRARPGLPVRRADDARRAVEYLDGGRRIGRRSARSMQHSHEALDRPGGFSRINLLAPLRHRDFRLLWTGMTDLARRRRHLPRRDGLAGLRALERPGRALAARDRDDHPDDRLPAARGSPQRPARPALADAVRGRRTRRRRRAPRGARRSPAS